MSAAPHSAHIGEQLQKQEPSSQEDVKVPSSQPESLAIREPLEKVQVPGTQPQPGKEDQVNRGSSNASREKRDSHDKSNGNSVDSQSLIPFDWEDFEARYIQAMKSANDTEAALLNEFRDMANYFTIWADASAQYDDERVLKRLKTREAYIRHSEQSLEEKRKHYTQVVEAFKNALALLGG